MKILETDRLILRTFEDRDVLPMLEINQDPKVMMHFPGLVDLAGTKSFIDKINRHFDQHGFTLYAVELKDNGTFIGFVGLLNPAFDAHFTPATEIGWRLSSTQWGRGYATEAALAVVHLAFHTLALPELVSFTSVNNRASRRVMEKIGMTHTPDDNFDNPNLPKNSPLRRHVLYRLTKM